LARRNKAYVLLNGRFNVALAAEGLGIAREPDFIVGPDVKSGRLKPILRGFEPSAEHPFAVGSARYGSGPNVSAAAPARRSIA
jgi:DNA-binding transcriptional LysR family regulator